MPFFSLPPSISLVPQASVQMTVERSSMRLLEVGTLAKLSVISGDGQARALGPNFLVPVRTTQGSTQSPTIADEISTILSLGK